MNLERVLLDTDIGSDIDDAVCNYIMFHDPLAATTISNDNICRFARGDVRVETESNDLKGLTQWTPSADGKNEVAVDVDAPLFFDHLFNTVGR